MRYKIFFLLAITYYMTNCISVDYSKKTECIISTFSNKNSIIDTLFDEFLKEKSIIINDSLLQYNFAFSYYKFKKILIINSKERPLRIDFYHEEPFSIYDSINNTYIEGSVTKLDSSIHYKNRALLKYNCK